MKKLRYIALLSLLLTSCSLMPSETSQIEVSSSTQEVSQESSQLERLIIEDRGLTVYSEDNDVAFINKIEGETFEYEFEGDSIRIENDKIIAVRGKSSTEVRVTSSLGRSATFTVNVSSRRYTSTHSQVEASEKWFDEVDIQKVNSMTSEFANGMDISSLKQLYDNGQKFYNSEGIETSLLYILKDAGVNWIRLRLWNKPYDTYTENGETKIYKYGGGNCTKENMAWIAHEARAAGLKVLLNFHYSDFWSDPSNQIVPKDWVNIDSVNGLASAIKTFTKDTLEYFKAQDALPDMVAVGNEISSGILIHNPGEGVTTEPNGNGPIYSTGHSDRWNGLEGRLNVNKSKADNYNFRQYLKAGVEGINEVDSSIQKMVHYVKGFSAPQTIVNFVNIIDDLGFDVLGLSAYPALHYSNASTLRNGLQTVSQALPNNMKVALAEISYGFTYESDNNAKNAFYEGAGRGEQGAVSSYEVSPQGQALCIRDASEIVSNLSNGFGVFYWEGAWTPTKLSGWADEASKVSWANQALFSYNGKALGSLAVYNKMLGK